MFEQQVLALQDKRVGCSREINSFAVLGRTTIQAYLRENLDRPLALIEVKIMTPTAFISYSWDDDTHKEWVKELAKRLRQDGVDVTLDRWATAPGDQLPAFMEQAIRENQFILIICTPRYKSRSDERKGGVGYEGDIMTAEVMAKQNHRKFIPILRKGKWNEAAPSWCSGNYHIDLSGDSYSEKNYEDLVRTLLENRETAPPIGKPMETISHADRPDSKLFDEIIQALNAEIITDNPEGAKKAAVNLDENPRASLIDKAIIQAVFLQQQGKRDEAIEKWRAVALVTEGIDNDLAARAWFSVGYLLANPEDSLSAYDRAIVLEPPLSGIYTSRGAVKGALGRYEEAIADYDKAISLQTDDALAYYNRGNAKAALGQNDEAITDYDRAIVLDRSLSEAYNNRGIAKGALGRYEDAIADFDKAISLKPIDAFAYNNRGIAKGALGRYKDAIADYDEAIQLKSDDALTYNDRGIAKGALGRYEDAIADYDEAISLKPDYAAAYINRGIAKGTLGRYEDAIADYDEAISLQPDDVKAYINRGNAKAALEQREEAIADYNRAIVLEPSLSEAYNNRGIAKTALDLYEEAIFDFDEAIRLKPDYTEAYTNRGIMKAALGRYDEAREDFEIALERAQNENNVDLVAKVKQLIRGLDADDT